MPQFSSKGEHFKEGFLSAHIIDHLYDLLISFGLLFIACEIFGRFQLNFHLLLFQSLLLCLYEEWLFVFLLLQVFQLFSNLAHVLVLHLFFEKSKVLFSGFNLLLIGRNLPVEFRTYFFPHVFLHQIVMVFQRSQFTWSHVKFINNLVSFMRHLSVDNWVNIWEELLALLAKVERFHFFEVNHMVVLVLHDVHCFWSLAQFFFSVLKQRFAKEQ